MTSPNNDPHIIYIQVCPNELKDNYNLHGNANRVVAGAANQSQPSSSLYGINYLSGTKQQTHKSSMDWSEVAPRLPHYWHCPGLPLLLNRPQCPSRHRLRLILMSREQLQIWASCKVNEMSVRPAKWTKLHCPKALNINPNCIRRRRRHVVGFTFDSVQIETL